MWFAIGFAAGCIVTVSSAVVSTTVRSWVDRAKRWYDKKAPKQPGEL